MKKSFVFIIFMMVMGLMSFSPSQILNTSLKITVRDNTGNIVEGAKVTLYKTSEDYQKEANPVSPSQTTDNKGNTTFKNLVAMVYFVHVVKDDLNNYGGGEKTDSLVANRLNKITIIIE